MNYKKKQSGSKFNIIKLIWLNSTITFFIYIFVAHVDQGDFTYFQIKFVFGNNIFIYIISIFLLILFFYLKKYFYSEERIIKNIKKNSQIDIFTANMKRSNNTRISDKIKSYSEEERELICIRSYSLIRFMIRLGILQSISLIGLVYTVSNGDPKMIYIFTIIPLISTLLMKPDSDEDLHEIHDKIKLQLRSN